MTDSTEPTPEELDCSQQAFSERLDLTRLLLQNGRHDGEIKKLVSGKYGCSPRTVERYLTRVRQEIREQYGIGSIGLQGDALEYYRGILCDPKAPHIAKIRARERMDKILGLEQSTLIHIHQQRAEDDEKQPQNSETIRASLLADPEYVEFQRWKSAREEELVSDGEPGEHQRDPDPGPVCEDGDQGDA